MDALKFLEECARMCGSVKECSSCPAHGTNCYITGVLDSRNKEQLVSIVEKWSAEHPAKTRQSEFLNMFPNARLDEFGSLRICPIDVDKNMSCEKSGARCMDCRKEYWGSDI